MSVHCKHLGSFKKYRCPHPTPGGCEHWLQPGLEGASWARTPRGSPSQPVAALPPASGAQPSRGQSRASSGPEGTNPSRGGGRGCCARTFGFLLGQVWWGEACLGPRAEACPPPTTSAQATADLWGRVLLCEGGCPVHGGKFTARKGCRMGPVGRPVNGFPSVSHYMGTPC